MSEPERLRTQAAILELLEETEPLLAVNGYDPFATEEDDLDDNDDVEALWGMEDEPEEPEPEEEPPRVTRRVRVVVRRPEEA